MILALIVGAVLSIVIGIYLSRHLDKTMDKLLETAQLVGAGDFNIELKDKDTHSIHTCCLPGLFAIFDAGGHRVKL